MKRRLLIAVLLGAIASGLYELWLYQPPLEPVMAQVNDGDIVQVKYHLDFFALDQDGYVLGAAKQKLHRIINGGKSTQLVYEFPAKVNGIHVMHDGSIIVATDDDRWDPDKPCRIYRSTDHGRSFTLIKTIEHASALWWSLTSDRFGNIYVGEYGPKQRGVSRNVWKSADGGKTWSVVFQAPDKESVHIHRVAVVPFTGYLWVTYGDEYQGVFVSRDQGATWTQAGEGDPTGVAFTPQAIYWGEDARSGKVRRYDRAKHEFDDVLVASRFGNFGGSIYDLALGGSGVIYAPLLKYPKEKHTASLWVGKDTDWKLLMTFEAEPGAGAGRAIIGGPDRFGMLYLNGYRIKDRPSW